jgi:hypothetical protein
VGPALVAYCLLLEAFGGQATLANETSAQLTTTAPPGFFSGTLTVQASVQSESRAGVSPIVAGEDPQSFVAELLTPRFALELRRPALVLAAWYGPRIFWEDPNPSATSGPLVLHVFGLTLDARESKDFTVTGSATGSIGEPDYTTLPQVLGTVQGMLPPVVDLAAVTGQLKLLDRLTDRWTAGLAGQASHWQWVDAPANLATGTITSQTSVSGAPAATLRLSTRDALQFSTAVARAWYSYGPGVLTVAPAVTWKRRLARRVDLSLMLGLTYAHLVGPVVPGATTLLGGRDSAVFPVGSAEIVSRLARRDEVLFQGRAFAGVDFFVDPITGIVLPRGLASAELIAVSVPSWMTTLRGEFGAPLEAPSVAPPALPPDETAFALSLSVRRRVTENFFAELGGRWADRGPALSTPDFHFHQRQLWAYLSITGTTRPLARPTLPAE